MLMAEYFPIVWLTLCVSGSAVALSSLIGIPLGAWLGLANIRGRRYWLTIIHTGMSLPPVVVGLALYLLLSRSGPLAELAWLFTPQAMITAQAILALPFVVGIVVNAVQSVPAELIMQLRSLGATPWQIRRTILREAQGGLFVAIAASFGRSISEVGAVLIVGGNIQHQTRVLTTAIVLETSKGNFELALALGATLLSLSFAVNFLILRLHRHAQPL